MSNLPVNFSDDILNASMNGRRRYQMITNADGTVSFLDVTNYDNFGNNYGAAEVNELNKIVNGKVEQDDVLQTLEQISANTDSNKVTGAMALRELNNKTKNGALFETLPNGTNLNDINRNGLFCVLTGTGIPAVIGYSTYFLILNYVWGGNVSFMTQVAFTGAGIFYRIKSNSAWGEWIKQ